MTNRNNGVLRQSIVKHRLSCWSLRLLIAQCEETAVDVHAISSENHVPCPPPSDLITTGFALLNLVQIALVAAILQRSQQLPVILCRQRQGDIAGGSLMSVRGQG